MSMDMFCRLAWLAVVVALIARCAVDELRGWRK